MQRCGSGLHWLTRDDTGGQPCTAAEVILSSRTDEPESVENDIVHDEEQQLIAKLRKIEALFTRVEIH